MVLGLTLQVPNMVSTSAIVPQNPHPQAANYVLGETGDTVIYIFPGGKALLNRDSEQVPAVLDEHQPSVDDEAALIDRLLATGKLTIAQVQVGRYDQEQTGLPLAEVLAARGWL